jgi:uncharacterized protein (TIGR00304 family)
MSPLLTLAAMLLILAGFLLAFTAFFIELLHALKRKNVEVEKHGGAVVMIGPVPIVFASDPKTAKMLLVLAIILTLILILLTVFFTYG